VRLLDYSCADEIVGKLLLAYGSARYFLLQGVTASHCEAIEPVLERHKLAAVAWDREGRVRMLGHVPEAAAEALSILTASTGDVPHVPEATAHELLTLLREQQLTANGGHSTSATG
jgi:NCAIR mutase (PurE)-related protein